MTPATSKIKNPNTRLHNEIIEFFHYIKPDEKAHAQRIKVCREIKKLLEREIDGAYLLPFGSFSTKLYLPSSDIDLGLISKRDDELTLIKKTHSVLKENEDIFENIDVLLNAKVRLIKFTHRETKIELDMTFNNVNGLQNIREVQLALEIHPEIKYLMMIFKLFLRQRRLHETFTGGIGSFLLFCLVLAFVRWYKEDMENYHGDIYVVNDIALGDILLKFLKYYGQFKVNDDAIHMIDGGRVGKKETADLEFTLFSPLEPERNIGGQSFKIRDVFGVFRNRFQLMSNKKYENGGSILSDLINPQYRDFKGYLV